VASENPFLQLALCKIRAESETKRPAQDVEVFEEKLLCKQQYLVLSASPEQEGSCSATSAWASNTWRRKGFGMCQMKKDILRTVKQRSLQENYCKQ